MSAATAIPVMPNTKTTSVEMKEPLAPIVAKELTSVPFQLENGSSVDLKTFQLSTASGVSVELCNIGASITRLHLDGTDIVLGYEHPQDMFSTKNPSYLGVVVGRVANRIAKGSFKLNNETYELAINNDPNHLHGGNEGFSHKVWQASFVENGVLFTYLSPHGDQNYPGEVLISAKYTLSPKDATLRLEMSAELLGDDDLSTPINLAQHTYWNLAGHDCPAGILDHRLILPSEEYTPTDATSIPTREFLSLPKDDPSMSFVGEGKVLGDALVDIGVQKAGLSKEEATQNVISRREANGPTATAGPTSMIAGQPYGLDHNYVVLKENRHQESLSCAGILQYENRTMQVWTDAPGVQIYTANWLNGDPEASGNKGTYKQWQALCLETQHFPDSILTPQEEAQHPEFAKGKTVILTPHGKPYRHVVEYRFTTSTM